MADRTKKSQQDDYAAIRKDAQTEMSNDPVLEPDFEELDALEDEVGLNEVYLDEAAIDAIPDDELDADLDRDGIEDEAAPEAVSNLPQEFTESYGTGLQGQPGDRTGTYSSQSQSHTFNQPGLNQSGSLTGGDVEANYDDADAVGEEAVGGTVAMPDQDVVDDLAAAAGVELNDRSEIRISNMLEERDDRRWELDPQSAEDYDER